MAYHRIGLELSTQNVDKIMDKSWITRFSFDISNTWKAG